MLSIGSVKTIVCGPKEKKGTILGKKICKTTAKRGPNKGKELITLDNIDTLTDDELSSSISPDLSLAKSSRARSRQRRSRRPAFSNADSAHSDEREKRQTEDKTSQMECLGTLLHYLRCNTAHALVYPTFGKKPAL